MGTRVQTEQPKIRTKRQKIVRRIVKITLWTVGSLVALLVLLIGVAMIFLTPARLTPIINDLASQYLNAEVKFENVDVSLWRDFPNISVGIDNAQIISYAIDKSGNDTLAKFDRLYVSLNALKLLNNSLNISAVRLVGADLVARIDSTGRASWEIYTPSPDTTTTQSTPIEINVEKLTIEGKNRARFVDDRNSTNLEMSFNHITAHQLGKTKYAIELDLGLQKAILDTINYDRFAPLSLRAEAQIDYSTLSVDSLKLNLGIKDDAMVEISGRAQLADSLINSDLTVNCSDLALERIVSFLPIKEGDELQKLHSDLQFTFAINVNGSYNLNSNHLPKITVDLKSNDGGVNIEGRYLKIDNFLIDASLGFEPSVPENNYLDLKQLKVKGTVGNFSIKGKATNYLGDYHVDGSVDGRFMLDAFNFWMPKQIRVGGVLACNVTADFWRHQLKVSKIGKAKLGAKITFDSVRFADDSSKMMLDGTITAKADKNVFILKTQIDTLNFDDKRLQLSGAARDFRFATGIKAEEKTIRDSAAIYPFGGSIMAKRLNLLGADSSRLRMRDLIVRFSIIPAKRDNTIPKMQSSIETRSLSVALGASRISLGQTKIKGSAELIRSDKEIALAQKRWLDSLQKKYPDIARSELLAHNKKMHPSRRQQFSIEESDLDLNPGKTISDLIRRWKAQGELATKSVRLSTPYMPLRTRLTDLDLMFNNDSVMLKSMKGKVGRSDISISGEVTGLRRAIQGRGVLNINIDMKSDTLDANQLIKASNAGMAMLDKLDQMNLDNATDDQLETLITSSIDTTQANLLVMIPKNVALEVQLGVQHAVYGNFVLNQLNTQLISRNKVLQIKELSADSEIGKLSVHALYQTPTKYNISTSADIDLTGVDIAKLIDQMPEIDTMLPMLASFEGVVDLRAAAKAKIDTAMNVIMPSLDAVATLKGKNLVLLDGETFAEISKMLSFKNKKRNLVDSISVEMKIANERVEFFPFIIALDRYKAAVSGKHGLDMKFDYHISVLKSIVPFRLGIDIKGNLDDWDFKITQAKYKSENLPSYTLQIDSTRINLRNEIINAFDKLNKEAKNATEIQNR